MAVGLIRREMEGVPAHTPGTAHAERTAIGADNQSDVARAPEPKPATPESQRAPAAGASVRIQSRIVSTQDVPVAAARILWIPLPEDAASIAQSWPECDWKTIDSESLSATSDDEGRFEIDLPRAVLAERRSVLWLLHPAHMARSILFAPPAGPTKTPSIPGTIELGDAKRLIARVLGPDRKPVVGAMVFEQFDFDTIDTQPRDPRELDARRVLRSMFTSDGEGRTSLFPIPGRNRVYATWNDLRSSPRSGRGSEDIVLQLQPGFTASGRVFPRSADAVPPGTSVRCLLATWSDTVSLDRSLVRADGSWGPLAIPIVGVGGYVFQLEGDEVAQERNTIPTPGPGAHIRVDFHPQTGLALEVRVMDEKNEPIPGADVSVYWNVDQVFQERVAKTDDSGLAKLRGCRPGVVWARARAPGFVPGLVPKIDASAPLEQPVLIRLSLGGRITGHCLHDGRAVADFTVLYFQGVPQNLHRIRVQDSTDGAFESDEVELGAVTFLATSEEFPQSDPVVVHVEAGRTAEVVVSVKDPLPGRGIVVDALTQEPITSATVQAQVMYDGWMMKPWKEPVRVDARGEFELRAFGADVNFIQVAAPGYAPRKVRSVSKAEQGVEFGIIGLSSTRNLEVQLVSDQPEEFGHYRAELQQEAFVDPRPFPPNGRLRFQSLPPGPYQLRVVFPDTSACFQSFDLLPGTDLRIEVPVRGHGLDVTFDPEPGVEIPHWAYLNVNFTGKSGDSIVQYFGLTDLQPVHVHRVEGSSATLEVEDMQGNFLAVKNVPIDSAESQTVEVPITRGRTSFRVVGADRQAIPGAQMTLSGPEGNAAWSLPLETDAKGECSVASFGPEQVFVELYHPSIGVAPSRLYDLRAIGSSPIDLVLAPDAPLALQLMERAVPASGVEVFVTDSRGVASGLGVLSSNANGIVAGPRIGTGEYRVEIRQPGYWRESHLVELPRGESPPTVQVRRLGSLQLSVHDAYDQPASGISIDLYSNEMSVWASIWVQSGAVSQPTNDSRSDTQGMIRWDGLPDGPYRWRALSKDGAEVQGEVMVPANDTARLTITVH
jgi:hypothetical protein